MAKFYLQNEIRNCALFMLTLLLVFILNFSVILINSYFIETKSELETAYDSTEVSAVFYGASPGVKPVITRDIFLKVTGHSSVRSYDAVFLRELNAESDIMAVNNVSANLIMKERMASCNWMDGFGPDVFASDLYVCAAPANTGLLPDDETELYISDEIKCRFKVAGIYEKASSTEKDVYYCPLAAIEAAYGKSDKTIRYSDLNLVLGNLRKLEEFRSDTESWGLDRGNARIMINDTHFQNIVANLKNQLKIGAVLRLLIYIAIVLISFIINSIGMNARLKNVALMRTLGVTRRDMILSASLFSLLQAVCGLALSLLLALIARSALPAVPVLLLTCAAFVLGGFISALKISSVNVMTLRRIKV